VGVIAFISNGVSIACKLDDLAPVPTELIVTCFLSHFSEYILPAVEATSTAFFMTQPGSGLNLVQTVKTPVSNGQDIFQYKKQ